MTARDVPEVVDSESELAIPEGAVGDSLSVATWTIVSRFTGVLRGITVAVVLGVTYFANTYQFTNSLPNLIFYGLLAGSLFSSLLVPALVQHIDSGDRRATARTAGALLGVALLGMTAIVPIVAVLTPWLLRLGSLGAANASAAQSQEHTGAVLVLLLLPQVPLYAVVGTATAVMNAHRRFALAAAAPALENLGTIVVLGIVAVLYSQAATSQHVPTSMLLLLGLGTTGAVLLHSSVQWWGARRVGIVLVPNAGWRDPQVRATIRRALPAVAQAGLAALQLGALLVVADRAAGGVVAFQLATNFYFLPIAVGATPVALSLVPRLSRMTGPGQAGLFRDTYMRGLAFATFLVVPAATAYAVLSAPLADTIGFGHFAAGGGRELLAASLLGLAPAIIGETVFLVTTYACYARGDTANPLRGMIIHTVVCAAGIAVVVSMHGPALLTGLGLAFTAGSIAAASYLILRLRRELPHGGEPVVGSFLRTIACSAIMAGPVWLAGALLVAHLRGSVGGRVAAMLLISLGGAGIYFTAQAMLGAPQVQWVTAALLRRFQPLTSRMSAAWRQSGGWRPPGWSAGQLAAAGPMRRIAPAVRRWRLDAALLIAPFTVGALAGVKIKYSVVAVLAIGIAGWVIARPAVAAYLLIFLTPLIVGLNDAVVISALRPNETLMAWLGVTIGLRWLTRVRTGEVRLPRLGGVEWSLIALAITSSVWPLLMLHVRQRGMTTDDLLYSVVLWKLLAEYVIVRTVITTREQAMHCLKLCLLAGAVVCGIGILQSLGIGAATRFLAKYYTPTGLDTSLTSGRGGSLLGLPAAVADLAILNLAIAVAMIVRGYPRRLWLGGLAALYGLGVVAAAEFSTFIGLLVALVALLIVTKSGRIAIYAIPVALIGAVLLWPVIQARLDGFNSATGLPVSWTDRLYNLRTYFWPTLVADHNWILGVRPAARIPLTSKRFSYVWIESGYTWLLWGGGLPLLGSYIAFVGASIRRGWAYTRRADAAGVAATAVVTALCAQAVLMVLDPHLTYRGSGDLLFMILALVRPLPGEKTKVTTGERTASAARTAAAPAEVAV
jgi:murein biosynthesis integral membrane protein MurJ